ncbi:MAG: SpoIIE family protein phosphatase [bacterium]|nr:SpoIIE family protein phosphatase [bacterium]
MTGKWKQYLSIVVLLLTGLPGWCDATGNPDSPVTIDIPNTIQTPETYRFCAGDNPQWANPSYDDNGWASRKTTPFFIGQKEGVIWARYKIKIKSFPGKEKLSHLTIGMWVRVCGAIEIFLDGRSIYRAGKVGGSALSENVASRQPVSTVLSFPSRQLAGPPGTASTHLLAVRFSDSFSIHPSMKDKKGYFYFGFDDAGVFNRYEKDTIRSNTVKQVILVSVFATISLLHFLLYFFYREFRANLYFGLSTLFSSVAVFALFQGRFPNTLAAAIRYIHFFQIGLVLITLFGLLFMYEIILRKVPKSYCIFLILGCILIGWSLYQPYRIRDYITYFSMLPIPESIRINILAFYKKELKPLEGGGIIGLGTIPLILVGVSEILVGIGFLQRGAVLTEAINPFYAVTFLVIAMSVFLSYRFAFINRELKLQLVKVKDLSEENLKQEVKRTQLEAENRRKAKELEEARQLQLSMLPDHVPGPAGLKIAASMDTATEVGGDYYDFYTDPTGATVVLIGDATGHGLQAGIMVAAAKSLFNAFAHEPVPGRFLEKSSEALKKMGFRKMFMAACLARFEKEKLVLASAGMPYPMIYRKATAEIEEVKIKSPPMGGFRNYAYAGKQREVVLESGDTVLFMSDGLPERFSPEGEMFGRERIREVFRANADQSPEAILVRLKEAGSAWSHKDKPDDDMTFVIVRVSCP